MPKKMNTDRLFNKASKAWDAGKLQLAFELFLQAANMGDASCQMNLGYFFDEGIHVKKDWATAFRWYKDAISQGDGCAAHNVAIHYRSKREYRKALWWFHRATRLDDHDAFLDIAQLYEQGRGVTANPKQAPRFYRKTISGQFVTEDSREKAQKALKQMRA